MATRKSALIRRLRKDVDRALVHGARVYAGTARGQAGREAIVASHFKRGAAARYGYPPLSPEYAKWKAKRFPGRPMLVLTGLLKRSIVGRGRVRLVGTGRAKITWRGLPIYVDTLIRQGRNPVEPDAVDRAKIVEAMQRWLDVRYNRTRSRVPARR